MKLIKNITAVVILASAYFFLFWVIPPNLEGNMSEMTKVAYFHILVFGGLGASALVIWAAIQLIEQ